MERKNISPDSGHITREEYRAQFNSQHPEQQPKWQQKLNSFTHRMRDHHRSRKQFSAEYHNWKYKHHRVHDQKPYNEPDATQVSPPRKKHTFIKWLVFIIIIAVLVLSWYFLSYSKHQQMAKDPSNGPRISRNGSNGISSTDDDTESRSERAEHDEARMEHQANSLQLDPNEVQQAKQAYESQSPAAQIKIYRKIEDAWNKVPTDAAKKMVIQHYANEYLNSQNSNGQNSPQQ